MLQLAQYLDCLFGEWNDVKLFHLHARCGYPPLCLFQVEFRPLGRAQLDRPRKNVGRKLQCEFGRRLANIAVNRPQQTADLLGVGERCPVRYDRRSKRTAQVGCGVALGSTGGNRIAKYLTRALLGPVGRLVFASLFDWPKDPQHVGRSDRCDRP